MISDRALAQEVNACMSECVAKLGALVVSAQGVCTESEYPQFRLAITKVMGEILRGVMNPLYAQHPDLKPPGWRWRNEV
jgi:hypothetical protein